MPGPPPHAPHESPEFHAAVARLVARAATGAMTFDEAATAIAAEAARERIAVARGDLETRDAALLLAEFDRRGGDRAAAAKVARRYARDPLDVERIAHRIRDLAQRRRAGG